MEPLTFPAPPERGLGRWQERLQRVRLGELTVMRSLAQDDPRAWQTALQAAYLARKVPECLCMPQAPVAMYIARLGDTYVLKRRPITGHLHHADCDSHGGISAAAHQLYSDEAIAERPDGKVQHALSVPLSTIKTARDQTLDEVAAPPLPTEATPRRSTMTLRGFLNLLWEEAGLARWSPGMLGKRGLSQVYWRLREELADRLIGSEDAGVRVFVPSTRFSARAEQETRAELLARFELLSAQHPEHHAPILLVVGELRSLHPTSRNTAVRLKGLPDSMPIWTPPVSVERLRQQWPAAMTRFERAKWPNAVARQTPSRQARIFLIAGVQLSAQQNLLWRYGAALETTEEFIPVDSQHEARIAQQLVAEGRRFAKPMRYDGVAATFADFVLTDMPEPLPMEIYGYSGLNYEERKRQKIALYQASAQPFWHWDVSAQPLPPPFPAVPSRHGTQPSSKPHQEAP